MARLVPFLPLALAGCGDDDQAAVRAVIDADGVRAPRRFRLERQDGRWKLADGSGG